MNSCCRPAIRFADAFERGEKIAQELNEERLREKIK